MVLDMIKQKMENQIRFLKRLMHARTQKESLFGDAIKIIERVLSDPESDQENLDEIRNRLMGLEGTTT
jgi:CRISPR-associated protein Cas1